jgi:hypothetical protein
MSSIAILIKLVPAGGSGESHNGFTSNHRCRSRAIRPNWMRRNRLTHNINHYVTVVWTNHTVLRSIQLAFPTLHAYS